MIYVLNTGYEFHELHQFFMSIDNDRCNFDWCLKMTKDMMNEYATIPEINGYLRNVILGVCTEITRVQQFLDNWGKLCAIIYQHVIHFDIALPIKAIYIVDNTLRLDDGIVYEVGNHYRGPTT